MVVSTNSFLHYINYKEETMVFCTVILLIKPCIQISCKNIDFWAVSRTASLAEMADFLFFSFFPLYLFSFSHDSFVFLLLPCFPLIWNSSTRQSYAQKIVTDLCKLQNCNNLQLLKETIKQQSLVFRPILSLHDFGECTKSTQMSFMFDLLLHKWTE